MASIMLYNAYKTVFVKFVDSSYTLRLVFITSYITQSNSSQN